MAGPERPEWTAQQRQRIDELIDEYRAVLHDSLEGLSEEEARRRLVPSKTTLLGLVKHANYVEGVWFDQAVTGRSYGEIGIPRTVDSSFAVRKDDTIETVQAEYRKRWETSTTNLAGRPSDEVVDGRGQRPVCVGSSAAGTSRARTTRRPRGHLARTDPRQPRAVTTRSAVLTLVMSRCCSVG